MGVCYAFFCPTVVWFQQVQIHVDEWLGFNAAVQFNDISVISLHVGLWTLKKYVVSKTFIKMLDPTSTGEVLTERAPPDESQSWTRD